MIFFGRRQNHKNQAVNLRTNINNCVQRFYKFIVVLFLLVANWLTSTGQTHPPTTLLKTTSINGKDISPSPLSEYSLRATFPYTLQYSSHTSPKPTYHTLSPDYYTKCLGFFCRVELNVEKKINIPLRFRVGSLDYLNKLEGKK
jgi:hypothetical protein